jgi:hypothetical protein
MARQQAIVPEVYEPDEKLPADLVALRRFAHFMDQAVPIPGTSRRFGADAALGLIPGVGELIGGVMSTWIIFGALRHRVPMRRILRMIVNVLLDIGLGDIPVIGVIFDLLFEENVMNMELLLRYRDRSRPPRRFSEIAGTAILILIVVASFSIALLVAVIAAAIYLINQR